jgi:hypothetical protein
MKPITRHTRAPRSGAFIRCPYCQSVSLVHHFSWAALTCEHCCESVSKDRWGHCDRSEVNPVDILRLGSPVTLRDGDEWATWMPADGYVISMYGTGGKVSHNRNRMEDRIQISREVALRQVQTHLEYGWKMNARGKGQV